MNQGELLVKILQLDEASKISLAGLLAKQQSWRRVVGAAMAEHTNLEDVLELRIAVEVGFHARLLNELADKVSREDD